MNKDEKIVRPVSVNKPYLYNDHFQNYKSYNIPKAQLIIADIPYNIGKNAYGSNPSWYIDGDKGDVVIDPVAGSGSTLLAAIQCDRKAYGFEIKKGFYKDAKEKVLKNIQKKLFTL